MPLDFFIVLSVQSHITSIHLPQKLGDLCENALFIYLQFFISLICLVYGSRFFWVTQQPPVLRHFQTNMMKCYKLLACSCKIKVQKSIFLSLQICEIFLELIFKQLFIVAITVATQDMLRLLFPKVQKNSA